MMSVATTGLIYKAFILVKSCSIFFTPVFVFQPISRGDGAKGSKGVKKDWAVSGT
jgi:hypothetical protein